MANKPNRPQDRASKGGHRRRIETEAIDFDAVQVEEFEAVELGQAFKGGGVDHPIWSLSAEDMRHAIDILENARGLSGNIQAQDEVTAMCVSREDYKLIKSRSLDDQIKVFRHVSRVIADEAEAFLGKL